MGKAQLLLTDHGKNFIFVKRLRESIIFDKKSQEKCEYGQKIVRK